MNANTTKDVEVLGEHVQKANYREQSAPNVTFVQSENCKEHGGGEAPQWVQSYYNATKLSENSIYWQGKNSYFTCFFERNLRCGGHDGECAIQDENNEIQHSSRSDNEWGYLKETMSFASRLLLNLELRGRFKSCSKYWEIISKS